jgi:PAS domain S-box-containing protein
MNARAATSSSETCEPFVSCCDSGCDKVADFAEWLGGPFSLMKNTGASDAFAFLGHDSETGAAIRAFDWRNTGLGPLEQWPAHLRVTTSLMLRSAMPMTLQWGRQGWLLYNDAYREIAGARHPDLLGKTISDSWPELATFREQVVARVLEGNTLSYRNEHMVLVRRDVPEDVWLDIDYSPVVDDAGVPVGVLAIVKDTTDRFRNEQRLRIAQEAGGVGTFELYPDSGRLEVSSVYRRVWGLDADVPVTTELLASLLHPDDRHAVGVHRDGLQNRLAYMEYRRVDPLTGDIRWIARRGEILYTAGTEPRFVGIAMDITDRKRAEQQLVESEKRWREFVERMGVKEIRHRNVRVLLAQLGSDAGLSGRRSGGMVMLAEMLGKSVAQVSRFAAETPSTRIGDRVAREIEEAFGKEHGWMDHAQWIADPEAFTPASASR